MNLMKDSIIYFSALIFGAVVRTLPLGVALWMGRCIGRCYYTIDFKNRAQTYANLKAAFAGVKSLKELKRIAKNMYANFGMSIVDMFRLPLLSPDNFQDVVNIEGKEYIDQARKRGKGVILVGMHAGSWEMANVVCAMLDFPYTLFANVQRKYSKLDKLLNSYRTCGGTVVLNHGSAVRDIVATLKKNGVVGMVIDQGGRKGEPVDFFGRSATMNSGVIRLAHKYDASIVFASIKRTGDGRHCMTFSKPIEVPQAGDLDASITASLKQIVDMMEEAIIEKPDEYMWVYKIWKFSKQARICVLSDGKMGHQRQSEAVASVLQKVLAEKRDIQAEVSIVPVSYKSNLSSKILAVLGVLYMPLFMRGRIDFLRQFLTDRCAQKVLTITADYIISCGSSIAALNFLIAKDHNAKSIVNLKPGLLGYNRFDLVVLPQHDKPKINYYRCRFAITYAVPNLVDETHLDEQQELLLKRFSHLKKRMRMKIGVLIGGGAKGVWLSEKKIGMLTRQLGEIAENLNADLLITTSRRTPKKIDQIIRSVFKQHDHCPLLIMPNQEDIDFAIGGIMGLSDLLIVSGDSLSMISEAVSSKKRTIVFTPETRRRNGKHMRFIKKLSQEGYIISVDVKNLGQQIYDVGKKKMVTRALQDNAIIYEELCEVI